MSMPYPSSIHLVQISKADNKLVTQDLPFVKPCWCTDNAPVVNNFSAILSQITDSIILHDTQVNDTGLKLFTSSLLPFLCNGVTLARFQSSGRQES